MLASDLSVGLTCDAKPVLQSSDDLLDTGLASVEVSLNPASGLFQQYSGVSVKVSATYDTSAGEGKSCESCSIDWGIGSLSDLTSRYGEPGIYVSGNVYTEAGDYVLKVSCDCGGVKESVEQPVEVLPPVEGTDKFVLLFIPYYWGSRQETLTDEEQRRFDAEVDRLKDELIGYMPLKDCPGKVEIKKADFNCVTDSASKEPLKEIQACAERTGETYHRAIGLADTDLLRDYAQGLSYPGYDVIYSISDALLIAHELGHTWGLNDEYFDNCRCGFWFPNTEANCLDAALRGDEGMHLYTFSRTNGGGTDTGAKPLTLVGPPGMVAYADYITATIEGDMIHIYSDGQPFMEVGITGEGTGWLQGKTRREEVNIVREGTRIEIHLKDPGYCAGGDKCDAAIPVCQGNLNEMGGRCIMSARNMDERGVKYQGFCQHCMEYLSRISYLGC